MWPQLKEMKDSNFQDFRGNIIVPEPLPSFGHGGFFIVVTWLIVLVDYMYG